MMQLEIRVISLTPDSPHSVVLINRLVSMSYLRHLCIPYRAYLDAIESVQHVISYQ